jgi:MoaA/NifB/PqqE/SkfB family radical SAM enzyme
MNEPMRCVFCGNEASDREGVPLCCGCWAQIDEQVRAGKAPATVQAYGNPLMYGLMRSVIFANELESAIASFGSLLSRLVGPPPGTRLN